MKVMVVGKVGPESRSSAAGTRTMGLIDIYLEAGWSVIFASTAQPGEHCVDRSKKLIEPNATIRIKVEATSQ